VSDRGRPRPGRRVAVIAGRGRFRTAEPLFERAPEAPLARRSIDAGPGEIVLADFGAGGARALRRLGRASRARDVAAALLWEGEGRRGFAPTLAAEAEEAAVAARESELARRDLIDLATFTVDPATARDFDDAVSAERDGDGIRLRIHIADVAAHVRPGSALDAESLRRATSTYVPGTVEPMLPAALSDGACSLAPGVDRLAVTAEIALRGEGEVGSARFERTLIRSDARLDYDQLDRIFAGREPAPVAVAEPLALARRAAAALAARRPVASLEVTSFEPEFDFDADGNVLGARAVAQTEAHRLIEHLMILTNERVAELTERRGVPSLYRVHELPDPARIELLVEQLAALGVPTPPVPEGMTPADAAELAARISRLVAREAERRGHGRDGWTSLVLRSLKQAYYSHRNIGHAGLGSAAYAHFTSPIRRYPDLVAHRALLSMIGAGEAEPDRGPVAEAGWRCSEREREAMGLERTADKVCACFLLERELFEGGWGRRFAGEVSGVLGAGAFVRFGGELGDVYEGFLPARRMPGDRFDLDETETALIGRRGGAAIRLGDPVAVRVDSVDGPRGRVDLVPADVEGGGGRRRPGRADRADRGRPARGSRASRVREARRRGGR
jgi:ribonuclease R